MTLSSRIYQWTNAALLTGLFLSFFGSLAGISSLTALHILAACLIFALLAGMQSIGRKGYLAGAVVSLALGALFVIFSGYSGILRFARSYLHWLMGGQDYSSAWLIHYEIIQTIFLTVLAFLIQSFLERYLKLKIAAGLLLASYLSGCMLHNTALSDKGVFLAFVYLVLIYVEWLQSRWRKQRKQSPKTIMAWLLPFMTAYCMLLLMMPTRNISYDWKWLKQICTEIYDSFFTAAHSLPFGNDEDFDTGYIGFSENAAMPGMLADNTKEIMTLQADKKLLTNVYLTGQIYDTFDGRQWTSSSKAPAYGRLLDCFQTINACRTYNEQYVSDYLQYSFLTIRYLKFHTSYLFAPAKTLDVTLQGRRLDLSTMTDHWGFTDPKSYGTEYELNFYQMNTGQEAFYRFLEELREPSASEWEQILLQYNRQNGQSLSLQDVNSYEAAINSIYAQKPPLSDSVQSWLLETTADCSSDIEKLRAIEKALSAYTYSTSPGALPQSVSDAASFLEYFLTESRRGYCVHYASAFVLLARASGIPARYVQGYLVPMKGKKEIAVTSDMAHAWPEVYIKGAGWIPFEPTPGYGEAGHAFWNMRQEAASSRTQSVSDTVSAPLPPEPEPSPIPEGMPPVTGNESAPTSFRILQVLGFALPITLLFVAVIWYLDRKAAVWKYRRMNSCEQFLTEIRHCQKLLSALHCSRKENETIHEFCERAADQLQDAAHLKSFAVYEDLLYGGRQINGTEIELVLREKEALLQTLKRKNRWKYLLYLLQRH